MGTAPNSLGSLCLQDEAGLELHQFWPLVEIKCAVDLKFFLCSLYAPICIPDYPQPLPACRWVCERAKDGCQPLMQQYGFQWPKRMNCDKLPVYGDPDNLCMQPDNQPGPEMGDMPGHGRGPGAGGRHPGPTKRPPSGGSLFPTASPKCKPGKNGKGCDRGGASHGPPGRECACRCRHPLVQLERNSSWYNRNISVAGVENCAFPCRSVFFSQEEKDFAEVWISLWSGLCALSTFMTITTFLIDRQRFKYPERPIVFLSGCYLMVSVGFLIRVGLGHDEVACEGGMIRFSAHAHGPHNQGQGPVACTIVFLLVYYFGMASSVWWVVLTLTWFLAAGLKWGNEAIAGYSQYFHLAAWLVPTVQTVAVLVMAAVDGDPVAGICYVGNQNADNLRVFVLAPLLLYLVLGLSFLIGGFVSLFRIRSVIKQQGGMGGRSKAYKLEKLMIRIGIFSVLYAVPATIVIGCHLYESSLFTDWMTPLACQCGATPATPQRPLYSVLMLKYFMALAVGITSGVWIWSGKTLDSWRRLWARLCGRRPLGGPGGAGCGGSVLIAKPRHPHSHPRLLPMPLPPHSTGVGSSLLSAPSLHVNPHGSHGVGLGHDPGHGAPNVQSSLENIQLAISEAFAPREALGVHVRREAFVTTTI
ncbi:frizzled-2-like [Frankliniella occidentalis]|uniref:Frizzled-2-like n=1 Tax=Frankliniella occidentalis TaxID=133901 RepID=A0A9C6X0Y3_FRAOC|nr:frizzled-2-like [Frankliniella occidentalis]